VAIDRSLLGSPSPAPRQIFAIGLNYSAHAKESGFEAPDQLPPVFTKFVSSLTGPDTQVVLPEGGNTDWEVELVAIIGKEASNVPAATAWEHVAGLSIGQDISERVSQLRGPAPSSGSGSPSPVSPPSGLGLSPRGSSGTRTTWNWGAAWTVNRCRKAAPVN
jgi:2-keto-4-pentenoate hydratase/2-oxohepta-3-ene-1,7-dioic acid hydratase in catechol pathway